MPQIFTTEELSRKHKEEKQQRHSFCQGCGKALTKELVGSGDGFLVCGNCFDIVRARRAN